MSSFLYFFQLLCIYLCMVYFVRSFVLSFLIDVRYWFFHYFDMYICLALFL